MSRNLGELAGRKGFKTNLFESLGEVAQEMGAPSGNGWQELAANSGEPMFSGTSSFYDFLRTDKARTESIRNGRHVFVQEPRLGRA